MAEATGLSNITELLKLFTGKAGGTNSSNSISETTSGGTSTKQTVMSQDVINKLLQSALEGNQGLSSVVKGQQSAGLYNSSTNTLLVNDLLSRLTTQTAAAAAPTVTTTPQTTKTVNQNQKVQQTVPKIPNEATGLGILNYLGKGKQIKDLMDFLTPETNGVGGMTALTNSVGTSAQSFAPNSMIGNLFADSGTPVASPISYDALSSLGEIAGLGGAAVAGVQAFDASTALAGSGESLVYPGVEDIAGGSFVDTGAVAAGEAGAELGAGLGATATETAIDSGILGGAEAALGGAEAGAGLGAEIAGAASGLGSILGPAVAVTQAGPILGAIGRATVGRWVICTELRSTGELPEELYQIGARYIGLLSVDVIRGYHWWAVPYTRLMRRSRVARNLVLPWALGRTKYLAGQPSFLGWLTVVLGEPICALLGKTVAKVAQDWESLYGN